MIIVKFSLIFFMFFGSDVDKVKTITAYNHNGYYVQYFGSCIDTDVRDNEYKYGMFINTKESILDWGYIRSIDYEIVDLDCLRIVLPSVNGNEIIYNPIDLYIQGDKPYCYDEYYTPCDNEDLRLRGIE